MEPCGERYPARALSGKEPDKRRGSEMIVERISNGAWEISDIIGGYRVSRTYYGHTLSDAVSLFKEREGEGGR